VSSEPTFHFPSILQPSQANAGEGTDHDGQLTLEEYQQLAQDVQLMEFAFDHIPEAILVGPTPTNTFALPIKPQSKHLATRKKS
jgi:hypothetical protein